jgi:four helix bundle protein
MPIKAYRDLNVFRESYGLALEISRATRKFPPEEQFESARQLRRAARSIPANIVEGWAKRSAAAEFNRYLQIAIDWCDDCKLWLELSRDEGFLNAAEGSLLTNKFNVVGAMLRSLWKQWKNFQS